ncbi:hypothetical protein ADUPG1_002328, partial [Aduncisulcus paluster]
MWGTVFNKVLGMILGGPGIIGSSTNQDYIKATLRKLQVINGVENKFRAFLIKASRISDEMGGSIVAMDQATDYVTRWQTLYSETLGSGRLQPDQSREAVDVFIEGIKPVGFRDKITRAVRDFRMMSRDEKRAQFRTGQFESDDLDGICWFTLQLARKADFHSVKYSGITGDVSSVSVPQDEP